MAAGIQLMLSLLVRAILLLSKMCVTLVMGVLGDNFCKWNLYEVLLANKFGEHCICCKNLIPWSLLLVLQQLLLHLHRRRAFAVFLTHIVLYEMNRMRNYVGTIGISFQ